MTLSWEVHAAMNVVFYWDIQNNFKMPRICCLLDSYETFNKEYAASHFCLFDMVVKALIIKLTYIV